MQHTRFGVPKIYIVCGAQNPKPWLCVAQGRSWFQTRRLIFSYQYAQTSTYVVACINLARFKVNGELYYSKKGDRINYTVSSHETKTVSFLAIGLGFFWVKMLSAIGLGSCCKAVKQRPNKFIHIRSKSCCITCIHIHHAPSLFIRFIKSSKIFVYFYL